ncbi:MAG: UvrD-helicase domain-containing protein, partial [Clostridiales bacterium]|nr:UvrD-helicase domain-containing protein [Clostridiales bacterium]
YLSYLDEMLDKREEADDRSEILGLEDLTDRVLELLDHIDEKLINELRSLVPDLYFVKSGNDKRQEAMYELLDSVLQYSGRVKRETEKETDPYKKLLVIKDFSELLDREVCPKTNMHQNLPKASEEYPANGEFLKKYTPVAALFIAFKKQIFTGNAKSGYGDCASGMELSKEYAEFLDSDRDTLLEDQKKRTEYAGSFTDLLVRLDKVYSTLKKNAHVMDYPDQEHIAKLILSDPDACSFYREKFKEIYIDEYQDNSALQDSIIELFERPEGNVIRVGDVKQSIYKFRNADPSLFIEKMNDFTGDDPTGKLMTLTLNRRSTPEILSFVNTVFEQTMTAKGSEIEYDESQRLNHPTNEPCGVVPRVLIADLADEISSGKTKEERNGFKLQEMGALLEVRRYREEGWDPGDICVITRKRGTASRIAQLLNMSGIPAKYSDEVRLFGDNDVHGMVNAIIALSNELRDEYLTDLLLSPYRISDFTLDELARIHLFSKNRKNRADSAALIDKLRIYADEADEGELKERVSSFLDWFDDIRAGFIMTDISELLDRLYRDTGIISLVEDRTKLDILKDWICGQYVRCGSDIAQVAASLEDMKINIGTKAAISSKTESEGKVRCMTMHASKGLDFKCLVVTELSYSSNNDNTGCVRFDPKRGLVFNDFDHKTLKSAKSLERIFYDEDEMLADNAESLRLLYVALTRGKERLSVVCGAKFKKTATGMKSLYNSISKMERTALPRQFWISTGGGMDIAFLASLMRLSGGEELWTKMAETFGAGTETPVLSMRNNGFDLSFLYAYELSEEDLKKLKEVPKDDLYKDDEAEKKEEGKLVGLCSTGNDENGMPLFEAYDHENASKLPFKVSVSQIKYGKIEETLPINLEVNDLEYFLKQADGEIGDSPSQIGTFVHRLFRFMDLEQLRDDPGSYGTQIDGFIEEGIMNKRDRELALSYKEGIVTFARSDIGGRVIRADLEGRAEYEKPLVFSVPDGSGEYSLVQGMIDLIFTEEDGEVIIDYKTDTFPSGMEREDIDREVRKRHSSQVAFYEGAVRSSGKNVKEKLIYLVKEGRFVTL